MNHTEMHRLWEELMLIKARFFGEAGQVMEDISDGRARMLAFQKRCFLKTYDGRELPEGENFSSRRGGKFYVVSGMEMGALRRRGVVPAEGREYACQKEGEVYASSGNIVFVDRLFPIYIFEMIIFLEVRLEMVLGLMDTKPEPTIMSEDEAKEFFAGIKAEVNKFWPGNFSEMKSKARAA